MAQKSRSQARPPLDASWQQSSALASESDPSQSDEKSNTKSGVGGDARASLNEDDRQNATVPQLQCELCVVLLHYSTRDCYSIGYREKEIERDLEVGFYVFEF